jgi:ubiquinone/menaquinone biosynthesis C-methylase UbiE
MDIYRETSETWNEIAALYEEKFMHLDLYNTTYDLICSSISKENANLLEIGCGPGNITKYLLTKRPDFNIRGIDIAPNMIKLAQKNNPTARFEVMDARQISQIKSIFDGIICGFCLPYLSETDCPKFFSDCHRLIAVNGLLYLSFVEGDPKKSGLKTGSSGHRTYFYYRTLSDVKRQLTENGFKKIKLCRVDYEKADGETDIHTILTAEKR